MLLSLPSSSLGLPVWIIMTGTTQSLRGYNRLIAKIVPLTSASRSADLIPYMVVRPLLACAHALRPAVPTAGQCRFRALWCHTKPETQHVECAPHAALQHREMRGGPSPAVA